MREAIDRIKAAEKEAEDKMCIRDRYRADCEKRRQDRVRKNILGRFWAIPITTAWKRYFP